MIKEKSTVHYYLVHLEKLPVKLQQKVYSSFSNAGLQWFVKFTYSYGDWNKKQYEQSPEENVHFVNVSRVQSDGMLSFSLYILESKEVVWHLWRAGHLTGPL